MHKGKAISRNSSIDSTTSSERRALVESKAQYRAEKNKNRPQRDGTPVGDRKKGGVNTIACAWQTAQQIRKSTSLSIQNRYIALDDDYNKTNRASSRSPLPVAHLPSGTGPEDNETENGVIVIDKEEDDDPNAGGNQVDS